MSNDTHYLKRAAINVRAASDCVGEAQRFARELGNGEVGRAGLRDLLDKLGNVETTVHQMQNELRRRLQKPADPKPRPLFDGDNRLKRLQGEGGDDGS